MTASATAPVLSRPSSTYQDNPPNARRTMEALREMGYDSYASVLDIADNSIDAGAKNLWIQVSESHGDIVIEIADDGTGMDDSTLSEALRLGSDTAREPGDLGKFGMGLVTASLGISKRVEVSTREQDGPAFHGGFDLDEIAAQDRFIKWVCDASSEHAATIRGEHGTTVRLLKSDRISSRNVTQFADVLRKRLGQVFRKFLTSGVRIQVNAKAVERIDPLMLSHSDTRLVLETDIEVEGAGAATIRVVDLPDLGPGGNSSHGIIPQNSGFYIVRNNREIVEAETFGFYKKHPDFSHFRAELSFDGSLDSSFHVDVRKMVIHPSQSFLDKLRQATQGLITMSGKEGRKRAHTARGNIDHSVAEANIGRRASLIPKPKALVERRAEKSKQGVHPQGKGERQRQPKHAQLKTISGLKVIFNEADHGEQSPFYSVTQEAKSIIVTYNREHPFYRELLEHGDESKVIAIMDYLVFALANAELLVPEQAGIVKANVNSTLLGLLV